MEKKRCHVHVTTPITCFSVPIVGDTELFLTPDEICECIFARAEVTEILENGKTVKLNFSNYNRDNSIIGEPMEEVKEEPVEEVETVFVTGLCTELDSTVVEVAETIATETEEVVEVTVEDSVQVEEEIEQEEEPIEEVEVVEEDTVKDYKVESRNKNNKKNKNRK